ncbi:hypothetical protein AHAS_Ahas03G0242100 [Arachis hypogaea]
MHSEYRAFTKRKLRGKTRLQSHIDTVVHREFSNWFRHKVIYNISGSYNPLMPSCL